MVKKKKKTVKHLLYFKLLFYSCHIAKRKKTMGQAVVCDHLSLDMEKVDFLVLSIYAGAFPLVVV